MKVTKDQVISLNMCESYSVGRVLSLFADRETLSLSDILSLEIPAIDKIWIIDKTGLLTEDQHNKIHSDIMGLVPIDSIYAEKFTNARIWEYAPICIYLRSLTGQTTPEVIKIIDDKIIAAITEISSAHN
jgi:hypothetical protein